MNDSIHAHPVFTMLPVRGVLVPPPEPESQLQPLVFVLHGNAVYISDVLICLN